MNKLKFILPLILATITLVTYRPIETQASSNQYQLTFIQGSANDVSGSSFPAATVSRIPKTQIINNTIIFNNTNWTLIHFWNNNTYLGHFAQTSFNNNSYWSTNSLGIWNNIIPSNATHFAINSFTDTGGDPLPNGISFAQFQTLIAYYDTPTPYTIEDPLQFYDYDAIKDTTIVGGFKHETSYSNSNIIWTTWWLNDDGVAIGPNPGDNEAYANSSSRYYLLDELLYLHYPLPQNITATGTYDLWLSLYNYKGEFIETFRPTSNNISQQFLRDKGAIMFRINYTTTYNTLPNSEDFFIQNLNSETWVLHNILGADGKVILQLGSALQDFGINPNLYLDPSDNFFNIIDVLALNNVSLPTLEGHTLLGFFSQRQNVLQNQTLIFENTVGPMGITIYGYSSTSQPTYDFDIDNVNSYYYFPIFEPLEQYVVTFLDYDGTFISSGFVLQGQQATLPPTPTRFGYLFSHWEPPVSDVQGNITTVAQYTPLQFQVTWRNTDFTTLKIENVNFDELATPPTISGLINLVWSPDPNVPISEATQFVLVSSEQGTLPPTTSGVTIPPSGTVNATGLTDLFTGVFGAIVGSLMILGTIDLFGLQLSSLLWLFFAGTGFMMVWKLLRG